MHIEVDEIISVIPVGKSNAKPLDEMVKIFDSLGWLPGSDKERKTRDIISRARMDYVIVNNQDGMGYFRPTIEDFEALRKYTQQEKNRAKEIGRRARLGDALLMDFYKERCDEQRVD